MLFHDSTADVPGSGHDAVIVGHAGGVPGAGGGIGGGGVGAVQFGTVNDPLVTGHGAIMFFGCQLYSL